MHGALLDHRRAVAERLSGEWHERRHYPYGRVRLVRRFKPEWVAAQPPFIRDHYRAPWFCIEDWAEGRHCAFWEESYRADYRRV